MIAASIPADAAAVRDTSVRDVRDYYRIIDGCAQAVPVAVPKGFGDPLKPLSPPRSALFFRCRIR
jgi:hypothetical protein